MVMFDGTNYDYYANATPEKIKKFHEDIYLHDWKVCFICEGVDNKEEKHYKTFECSKVPEKKYYTHDDIPFYECGETEFKSYFERALHRNYLSIDDVFIPMTRFVKAEVVEKIEHHLIFDWYKELQ